jgi:hypothetical protein
MPSSGVEFEILMIQVNFEYFFFTIAMNAYTYKDFLSRELVGYRWYLVDVENCKCALSWWCRKQNKFPTIIVVTQHILGILVNQIKTKCIFLLAF